MVGSHCNVWTLAGKPASRSWGVKTIDCIMRASRTQGLLFPPHTGKGSFIDNAHGLHWRDLFFFFEHLCRLFPNHFSGMLQKHSVGSTWPLPLASSPDIGQLCVIFFFCLPLGAFPCLWGCCPALSEVSNTPNVPVLSSWETLSPSNFLPFCSSPSLPSLRSAEWHRG